jgi:hypothetical protein
VDEGALCLSSLGYNHHARRNPDESHSHENKHKAVKIHQNVATAGDESTAPPVANCQATLPSAMFSA